MNIKRCCNNNVKWLTCEEAAAKLGLRVETLWRLIRIGKFPAYKIGRIYCIDQEDLQSFLKKGDVK